MRRFFYLYAEACADAEGRQFFVDASTEDLTEIIAAGFFEGNGPLNLASFPSIYGTRPPQTGEHVLDFGKGFGSLIIVSDRVRQKMAKLADQFVQFVPYPINSSDGELQEECFYLLRISHLIECIDRDRCTVYGDDWSPMPNGRLRFSGKVYYSHELLAGYPIVSCQETRKILFREDVVDLLAEFSGATFTAVRVT